LTEWVPSDSKSLSPTASRHSRVSRSERPRALVRSALVTGVGAVTFTWLQDTVARNTDYWRALLGGTILLLVLAFPMGIAGFVAQRLRKARAA